MYSVSAATDRALLSDYVVGHVNGNFFQTPEVSKVYGLTKGYEPLSLIVTDENGTICGSLLSVIQTEDIPILSKYTSRAVITGGPLVNAENSYEIAKELIKTYDCTIGTKALYTEIRNLWEQTNTHTVLEENGYSPSPHLNILVDLTKGEQTVFNSISKTKRRNIIGSIENGAEIVDSKNLDEIREFYNLLKDLYSHTIKKPLPEWSFFSSAFNVLHPKRMLKYFLIKFNGEVIGGIMCPIFKGTIYEWYICGSREHRNQHPSELATWAPIQWGVRNNLSRFDFLGAGKPDQHYGVRSFKEGFGGMTTHPGRLKRIHSPLAFNLSKLAFNLSRTFT